MSIKHDLQRSIYHMLQHNRDGSFASQADRKLILNRFAEDLVKLGYKLPHIDGLKNKHIVAVVEKWKKDKLANSTLKNQTSALRYMARKISKSNIVPSNKDLGIGARSYIPKVNRAIFDPDFSKISSEYIYASLQLERVFGLRRGEALKIRPHAADKGTTLMLESSWCKGGRERFIPILTAEQRQWLDHAKALVEKDRSLIPSETNFKKHRDVYDKQVRRADLRNMHGLRHAYAQRRYKELTGWEAPANGGPHIKDMTSEQYRKDHEVRLLLTEELGHSRKQILSSYLNIAVPQETAAAEPTSS